VVEEAEVPVRRLDDLTSDVDEITVLKIDVQGGEAEVIGGAHSTLRRTRFVLLEVTFVSHYEGDSAFCELNTQMEELGFHLANLAEPVVVGTRAQWTDALYTRS
jgi:hypothetical protein